MDINNAIPAGATPLYPKGFGAPKPERAKKHRKLSRADRWFSAVSEARAAADKISEAWAEFEAAIDALRDVQSEFSDWLDNLPENLQGSALGEKLGAIADLDLDSFEQPSFDALDEAEGAELPLGFGRD